MNNSEIQGKSIFSKMIIKIIFSLLVFFFSFIIATTCSKNAYKENLKTNKANVTDCKNSINYGGISICLPEIDGMKECHKSIIVSKLTDRIFPKSYKIIAYYLNKETYKKINDLFNLKYDDYLLIYGQEKYENSYATQSDLEETTRSQSNNFDWNDSIKNIEKRLDSLSSNISIGKPVLIENYSPCEEVKSTVMLTKLQFENNEYVITGIMNIVLIKNRLIIACYYKDYDGPKSVKAAKAKNDYMILQLVNENK